MKQPAARSAEALPSTVAVDGRAIRARRVELGDNLRPLADRAGMSVQYLSQLERGQRSRMSPSAFRRLAEALGMADRAGELRAA